MQVSLRVAIRDSWFYNVLCAEFSSPEMCNGGWIYFVGKKSNNGWPIDIWESDEELHYKISKFK